MKGILLNRYWVFLLRLALGGVFIWASIDKILHPLDFAWKISNYRVLAPVLVNILAVVLPWIEILCGMALVVGIFTDGAVVIICLLLIIFMAAMGQAVFRGIDIGCGCFKVTTEAAKVGWERIGEDFLMFLAAINILSFRRSNWKNWGTIK